LCDHCTGKCCRYFSLPIDTPATWAHFRTIGVYLRHPRTLVYVDKATWYLLVSTRCKYLTSDNRCATYLTRPKICLEYTTAECEYDEDWRFEKAFETPEQIAEYAEAVLRRAPQVGSQPAVLPSGHRAGQSCRCFRVPIATPTTWDDYDAIRWYLAHGQAAVYVQKRRWFLFVLSGAKNEPVANRCTIDVGEPSSPQSPRSEHGAGRDLGFEKIFETPEQLWEYAEAALPPRRRPRRVESALPIITLS
jgi:hypothetical protein